VAEAAELADLMRDETPKLDSARREAEHAERAARAARAAAADAERAVAVCRDDLEHRRTEQSQRALRDQLSRVTRAREAGAAARRLVAESRVDEARVHEIQQAQVLVERARARLEAEGARVLLTPEIDLEVSVDGRRQRIAAGTPTECRVAESWMLHADGVADITVLAGASATEQRKRLEEADTRLRTLCAEIGVDDHAGAVQALEARRRAEGQIRESGLALEEALAGATELALEEKIARHEERIATYPTQRDDHGPIPPDAEAAAEALAAAEAHARHAGDARDQLDARRDDTRARHEGNERRLHETRVRLELAQGSLDDLGARLVAAREVREDEALEARREASHARAQAAESTLRDAQTRLAACDPDTVEAHACSARDERERAARALRDAKEERLEVRARMSVQADSGLFERTEEAQAAAETAERDRRATRRRAAAARLLAETLQARREASRAGYAEPLRREIVALGRRVYGDDFDVRLNDALQVERRTLDGIDLPVTSLSAGAREQLALLTRLACAQLVGGTGGVPILLDDALGHTDPERLRSLCDVLTAATACQVVLLSCDPGRFRSVDCARVVELG
jgi:hypothetical protein